MTLEIRDKETREMATEIARRIGTSEEGAVRQALEEKQERMRLQHGERQRPRTLEGMLEMMEREIWSQIPDELLGGPPISKEEKEELLGYGPEGF